MFDWRFQCKAGIERGFPCSPHNDAPRGTVRATGPAPGRRGRPPRSRIVMGPRRLVTGRSGRSPRARARA